MGKSKSIEEQQKVNLQFQKYIDEMSNNMKSKQDEMSKKLDELIVNHYKSFTDKALLQEGAYSHLTTTSEWSLDSVNQIIDFCCKSLFGGKSFNGTDVKKQSQEVSDSIIRLSERDLYIANCAFDIIQGILSSFTNGTSTNVEIKYDGKPIAPGMSLFIGVLNCAYINKKFFDSDKIVQTIYVFKVYYSIEEGVAESKLSDLQSYENQKSRFRKLIEENEKRLNNIDFSSDDFEEQLVKIENVTDLLTKRLESIGQKIIKLSSKNNVVTALPLDIDTKKWDDIHAKMKAKLDDIRNIGK